MGRQVIGFGSAARRWVGSRATLRSGRCGNAVLEPAGRLQTFPLCRIGDALGGRTFVTVFDRSSVFINVDLDRTASRPDRRSPVSFGGCCGAAITIERSGQALQVCFLTQVSKRRE